MKKILTYIILFSLMTFTVLGDPVLDSISDQTLNEGETLTITINCTIPDNGDTVFRKTGQGTLSKSSNTQAVFTWAPGFEDSGAYTVVINASDDNSSDTESFQISVNNIIRTGVSVPAATLGGDNQDRGETASQTFTIANTGDAVITDIDISSTAASRYRINFTNVPSTLSAGSEATVTVRGYVPLDLDAVDEDDGSELIHNIGNIVVSGSSAGQDVSDQSTLRMQAENKLSIDRFEFAGDSVNDGDEVDDEIKPGDEVEVFLRLESFFNDRGDCDEEGENCDIEDIEAWFEIDDLNIDEDFDFDTIDPDEKDEDTVTIDIDEDEDDDTYSLDLYVIGEDENGAFHGENWDIEFEITRETHEISIIDINFNPTTLECNERFILAEIEIENTGKRDEDRVTLDIENEDLDILESEPRIEVDEGDEEIISFDLRLPTDTEPGTYFFDIIAFYDNNERSDIETQRITVLECDRDDDQDTDDDDDQDRDDDQDDDDDGTQVDYIEVPPSQEIIYGEPDKDTGFESNLLYVVLLVLGIVVVLLLIIILLAVLFK
ncbi:hypothetical protein GF327_09520 [Candidatus Woesearchaeota archaeon]|nr:hypothetical protein [Candidatus Woesearchaeota archaeon]